MEADLDVLCECRDKEQRDLFVSFLDKETRPLLDDDVDKVHRNTFLCIDNIAEPGCISPSGDNMLDASWQVDAYGDEAFEIMEGIISAGAQSVFACLTVDGDLSTARMFKAQGDSIQVLENWSRKRLLKLAYGKSEEDPDPHAIVTLLNEIREEKGDAFIF